MKRKLLKTSAMLLSIMLLISGCRLRNPMYAGESSSTQENTLPQIPSDSENGLQNPGGGTSLAEDEKLGFQKTMNASDVFRLNKMCKGSGGYYLENEGLLYYLEPESGRMIPVCSKPNCQHKDDNCNAWINSSMLTIYEDTLYFANGDGFGQGLRLFSMNPDGTGRKQIQELETPLKSDNATITFMSTASPILYNGMVVESYWSQWLVCGAGILLVALGVSMEVAGNVATLPGEGTVLALCRITPIKFGYMKVICDSSMVVIAAALILIFHHKLEGVREGTVAAAILVGLIAKLFNKFMLPLSNLFYYGKLKGITN